MTKFELDGKTYKVRWDKMLGALVLMVLIAGMVVWGLTTMTEKMGPDGQWYPPCESEDSDNCYWDADEFGNGQGKSFWAINGVVTYWKE